MFDSPSGFCSSASLASAPPLSRRANKAQEVSRGQKASIRESESALSGIPASVPCRFPRLDSSKISLLCATHHIPPFFVHGEPISREEHPRGRASRVRGVTECPMRPRGRTAVTPQCRQTSKPANRQTGKPANLVVCQLRCPYFSPSSRPSFVRCSFAM